MLNPYKIAAAALMMLVGLTQGCLILGQDDKPEGYTECGDFFAPVGEKNYCQPGQYCDDPTFSECRAGCFSNENCAEDQRCVKADGTQIGSCQATIKRPASEPRNTDASGNTVSSTMGVTRCGDNPDRISTCQPGQYCYNSYFARCEPGCLSDLNCASEQLCVKDPGKNVGTCQRGSRDQANAQTSSNNWPE